MADLTRAVVAERLRAALDRFGGLVGDLGPADRTRPVPTLPGWDVGDAVAHVLTVLRRGTGDMRRSATAAETAALNQACLDEVAERDLVALAALVAADGAAACANLDLLPVDLEFPFHAGTMSTVVPVSCVVLGELVVHGHDIATACGVPWPIEDEDVALVLAGIATLMPAWRRPDAPPGRVELRLEGLHGLDLVIGEPEETGTVHVVRGRPSEVLLAFPYGRRPTDDPGLLALIAAHQPVWGLASGPMSAPLAPGYRESVLWHDAAPLAEAGDEGADGDGPPPTEVDVVVVGAGYCGLAAAAELARRGRSVAVLDRGPLGIGASTRNGGMVLPELKTGPRGLQEAYGDLGRRMFEAVDDAFALVEELTTGPDGIACDYARTGRLELASGAASAAALERAAEELEEVGHGARYVTGDDLAAEIGSAAYPAGLVVERSGGLHPARFHAGLVDRARAAGATLHPGRRVTAVRPDGVDTATGSIRCGDVLLAVNGHPDGAAPDLRRRILPMGSFIVATEPLPPELQAAVLPTGRMAYDTRNLLSYWRLDADGRMVFGGRRSLGRTTVPQARDVLRDRMVHVHPQLAETPIERAWGGEVAITRDRLPHCGRIDGAWYAGGCNGSGVALNTWLGHRMAAAIDGEELPPFAELDHPRVPPVRRAWLPVVSSAFRAQDRLDRARPPSG